MNVINSYIHLTNYSVQKYNENFSKYEEGNEVSFKTFQGYIDDEYKDKNINIYNTIFPKMCEIIKITISSVKDKINIFNRQYCFEIFGYDFILDCDMNPFLLEINSNPGLEESSNLIKEIVPRMLDDAFRLTIDDIFTPIKKSEEPYKSIYHVDGYDDKENLWYYISNIKDKEFDEFELYKK